MIVAHLDLDAFFAAVEELENPELRTKPLVVGGDPHGRGVVSTANYVARRYGIGSAMSCAEALRRCPAAVFVRPRHTLYRKYSREVWTTVREIVPTLEQTGIDEGYLDLEEVAPVFDDARAVAETVQAVVRARTRLSCSLGVATSKVVAKIASDRRKPGGLTVVRPGGEARFLAPLPLRLLPGVGPRADDRLRAAGIETIGDLAALGDDDPLVGGKVGRALRDRARGIDPRRLDLSTERISVSVEETFAKDVGDTERLHDELRRMAERLAEHLRAREQTARTITTKLRYPDFSIRTRSTSLPVGIDDAARIGDLACALLDRALRDRPGPLRLVGVGLSGLAEHAQLSLTIGVVEGYPFAAQIRVRFAETDAQGVAHNSNYFIWFEVARVEFLERYAGGYQKLRDEGVESLVLESHAHFRQPAFFDDRLQIHTRCHSARGARFRFDYVVARGDDVLADGWTMHGTVDAKTLRPTRTPEWLASALTATG